MIITSSCLFQIRDYVLVQGIFSRSCHGAFSSAGHYLSAAQIAIKANIPSSRDRKQSDTNSGNWSVSL